MHGATEHVLLVELSCHSMFLPLRQPQRGKREESLKTLVPLHSQYRLLLQEDRLFGSHSCITILLECGIGSGKEGER